MNMRRVYNGIILLLIAILVILLYFNFRGNKIELSDKDRVLFIGKQNLVAIYEDKLAIDIPYDIRVNKESTFGDLIKKKEYEEVLRKVNDILPEKIEKYIIVKYGSIDYKTKNSKKLPETSIDEKRYALTSSVYNMFDELYYEDKNKADVLNQNIIVDVLNANGRGGYARKTGELLTKELSVKYNAANYEKYQEESYIILNDISIDKARDIVMLLPEKYFKVKEKPVIPTLANIIVVLGKEKEINFSISLYGASNSTGKANRVLKKEGYQKIKTSKEDVEKSLIKYNKEDYFIAYKIGQKLGIKDMIEKDSLSNRVEVYLK